MDASKTEEVPVGGYDVDFVEQPLQSLECSICLHVYRNPLLLSCCGNHFCEGCIAAVMKDGKCCPLCAQPNFSVLLDRGLQRRVNELRVRCANKDRGCLWQGELGKMQEHLRASEEPSLVQYCKFEVMECSQGCAERYQRRFMTQHQKNTCPCRPYICTYCEYESIYEDVRTQHWPVCPNYPVKCPNKCSGETLPRRELEKHIENECPLEKVECEFGYAGCKARVLRKDMTAHVEGSFLQHLSLLSKVSTSLLQSNHAKDRQIAQLRKDNKALKHKIEDLKATHKKAVKVLEEKLQKIQALVTPVLPMDITVPNVDHLKQTSIRWFSPPFYNAPNGYKMCLRVDANGVGIGKGSHVSVMIHFQAGEYDETLQWPFQGTVTVRLLNQRENSQHHEVTIPFTDATPQDTRSRVESGSMSSWGWGCQTFVAHSNLQYQPERNREYCSNNCLHFVVSKVDLTPV